MKLTLRPRGVGTATFRRVPTGGNGLPVLARSRTKRPEVRGLPSRTGRCMLGYGGASSISAVSCDNVGD